MDNLVPISGGSIVLGGVGIGYGANQLLGVNRTMQGSVMRLQEVGNELLGVFDENAMRTLDTVDQGLGAARRTVNPLMDHMLTAPIGPRTMLGYIRGTRELGQSAQSAIDQQLELTVGTVRGSTEQVRGAIQDALTSAKSVTTNTLEYIKKPAIRGGVAAVAGFALLTAGLAVGMVAAGNKLNGHD